MEQGTILDRREFHDRRIGGASTYTGPERRKLKDRRCGIVTICVFCGEVCGSQRGWVKSPPQTGTAADYLLDVCADCYSKRFTHTFTKTETLQ